MTNLNNQSQKIKIKNHINKYREMCLKNLIKLFSVKNKIWAWINRRSKTNKKHNK